MLRLNQLYFRNFSILFIGALLGISVIGYFFLENIEINNYRTMLKNMINQFTLTHKDLSNLNTIVHKIKEKTSVRITIIDKNGNVKFESNRAVKGMGNHLLRPEIQDSLKSDFGSSIRYSKSVDIDFLYVAKKYDNHFVRMAYALDSIKSKFLKFWLYAIVLFSLALFLSLWVAWKINRKISNDLESIKISLDNLLNKKYNVSFDEVKCCEEFDIIAKQISKVSKKLEKRERQKSKYTKNLKALSKKQGDIISAISHEFKNPIAAIMGYAQSVRDDRNLNIDIKDKFLDKVIKNAHKISYMIDRLSMAIKLENDTFVPKFSYFNLASILNDVKDMLLQKYKDREILIEVEDFNISADRVMFENLLTNLIENALKYSEGIVSVQVRDGNLEIIDTGIGIDSQDLHNITKRFFRVDSLTWDNSIGIGLYIVKYILKLHGSYLKIESTLGIGSKFYFNIKPLTKLENI